MALYQLNIVIPAGLPSGRYILLLFRGRDREQYRANSAAVTDRLYYHDSYLKEFRARVVDASPDRRKIYLDRTAFYPASGGQPFDTGLLGGAEVTEVVDEEGRIAHVLSEPVSGERWPASIDWQRRFDHMQQHTGQHLLSAVLIELFNAPTVSFHLGADASTIDIGARWSQAATAGGTRRQSNCFREPAGVVSFEDSSQELGLRKPTDREGEVRIVTIQDLDRSACGGTHVRCTGEIGPILIRKLDRIRGNQRIEFVCGMRAVERAQADYEALSAMARAFSAGLDETPAMVAAHLEKLQESEKARRRLATELAQAKGRELHAATVPAGMDCGGSSSASQRFRMSCERKHRVSRRAAKRFFWRWRKILRRCCWRHRTTAASTRVKC